MQVIGVCHDKNLLLFFRCSFADHTRNYKPGGFFIISPLKLSWTPGLSGGFNGVANDPRFHAFVCENGGMVLAFINLRIDYQIHHAAKVAEIMELVTKEDCRGQGIGRELFRHACQFAREEGCVQIELNSSFRRTDAHRFYETKGMVRTHYGFTMPL